MKDVLRNNCPAFCSWLFIIIPFLWLCGIHPNDLARIIGFIFILLLLVPSIRSSLSSGFSLNPLQRKLLLLFVILYPTVIFLQHLFRIYTGSEGINFAYFSNILDNFPKNYSLLSTLNRTEPYNHLLHHFSPIFYLPALLTLFGIMGYLSLLIFEFIIIVSVVLIFRAILKELGYSSTIQYLLIILLISNFSLRHSFSWSVEDEFFALPFIALCFLYYIKRKPYHIIICLLLTFSVKENMFLFGFAFSLMIVLQNIRKAVFSKKFSIIFASLGILSLLLFIGYLWGQPILFGKTYDHFSKLEGFNCLLDIKVIVDKIWYLLLLLFPFLFFPVFCRRGYILIIPAIPFLLLSLVSCTPQLYNPMDYYSAVPTLILAITTVINLSEFKSSYLNKISNASAIILISISFMYGSWKPTKIIFNSISQDLVTEKIFSAIPENSVILTTETMIPLLGRFTSINTLEGKNIRNLNYDFLIIREKEKALLSDSLKLYMKKYNQIDAKGILIYQK